MFTTDLVEMVKIDKVVIKTYEQLITLLSMHGNQTIFTEDKDVMQDLNKNMLKQLW